MKLVYHYPPNLCCFKSIDDIKDVWSSREGRVIETAVDNEGCVFL